MTNVTYNLDIPDENNNPSNDQPDMKTNTNAVDTILAVDHYSFNVDEGGHHKQVSFDTDPDYVPVPGAQAGNDSVLYTSAGVASTAAYLKLKNANATFPISAVRAFGVFTSSNVAPAFDNSFNAALAGSGTTYTITLTASAVTGDNAIIIPFITGNASITYTFTNPTLTLTINVAGVGQKVSFVVLQA